jgi:hypothetical protein
MSPNHPSSHPQKALRSGQLALLAGAVFDVPARTRRVVGVAGIVGLGLLVMGMLASPEGQNLQLDKALHLGGFCVLGALLVLSLAPVQFVPGLAILAGLGVALEQAQAVIGRSVDRRDLLSNLVGIAIGAALGLLARSLYSYLRRDLAAARVRRRLLRLRPGDALFEEGDPGSDFYLVRRGQIELRRLSDGDGPPLGVFGPGEVVGVAAAILGQRRAATARAVSPASVLPMTLSELIQAERDVSQPAAAVLTTLAEKLRELVARIDAAERKEAV